MAERISCTKSRTHTNTRADMPPRRVCAERARDANDRECVEMYSSGISYSCSSQFTSRLAFIACAFVLVILYVYICPYTHTHTKHICMDIDCARMAFVEHTKSLNGVNHRHWRISQHAGRSKWNASEELCAMFGSSTNDVHGISQHTCWRKMRTD